MAAPAEPAYQHWIAATAPPPRMDLSETLRVRTAAWRAGQLYPGAVGVLLRRELEAWADLGLRMDSDGVVARAVAELLRPYEDTDVA